MPGAVRKRAVIAGAAVAVAAAVVIVAVATRRGSDKPRPRPPAARPVRTGATGRLGPASFRIDHVYTGSRLAAGRGAKARGVFLVAYLQIGNRTDVLQPLHLNAFRLQIRGRVIEPYGRTAQTSVVLQPAQATAVELPFDVPPARLRGARLLIDRVSRSAKRLGPGLAMGVPLDDGIGAIAAGTWQGSTSQGLRLTMRVDRGSVIRRLAFNVRTSSGRICPVRFKGVYFIDGTRFALRGAAVAAGRFSTSTEADGAVVAPPGGRCSFENLRWTATTPLR